MVMVTSKVVTVVTMVATADLPAAATDLLVVVSSVDPLAVATVGLLAADLADLPEMILKEAEASAEAEA